MDYITSTHNDHMKKLAVLKSQIDCDGDVCKRVKLVPPKVYDKWVNTVKLSGHYKDEMDVAQRRFNVLCNLLFKDRGDFMVTSSNHDPNDVVFVKENNIYCDFGKMDISKITESQKNSFFVVRNFLENAVSNEFDIIADCTELTLSQTFSYYRHANQDQHIAAYLLVETFEKLPNSLVIKTPNIAYKAIAKLISRLFDLKIKIRIE